MDVVAEEVVDRGSSETEGLLAASDVVGISPPILLVAELAAELATELAAELAAELVRAAEVLEGTVLAVKAQVPHDVDNVED